MEKHFLYKVSPFIHNVGLQLLDIFKNSMIIKYMEELFKITLMQLFCSLSIRSCGAAEKSVDIFLS